MTSEQNVPEVESHQGSTMSPGQQDGEAQFHRLRTCSTAWGSPRAAAAAAASGRTRVGDAQQGAQSRWRPDRRPARPTSRAPARATSRRTSSPAQSGQASRQAAGHPAASAGRRSSATATASARRRIPATSQRQRRRIQQGNGGGYRDRDTHQPGNNAAASSARAASSSSSAARAALSAPWTTAIAPSTATSPIRRLPPSIARQLPAATARWRTQLCQSDSQPIDYSQGRADSHPRRRADQDLLLHRRSLLHREDSGDSAQTRRQGRLRQEREGRDRGAYCRRRRRPARPDRLRPEQRERQAPDADSQAEGQAEEEHLDHRLPLAPAGRSEGQGSRSGLRHGDAARRLLAEPAEPPAPLRHRTRKKSNFNQ